MTTPVAAKPALGPQEALLLERVQRSGRAVIRMRHDRALFEGFAPNALRLLLQGLADGGWLHRIERGVYAVAPARGIRSQQELALLADWLDGENYVVTGFFALAHWNLTRFPASTIDILLDRRRPNVIYGPTLFRFIYVPADRQPEYKETSVAGARATAHVITPEGALADVLAGKYATDLGTSIEAYRRGLRIGVLTRRRLTQAVKGAPATAARRLGWIAEHEDADDPLVKTLRPLVGNDGYVALDPTLEASLATRNTRWRVLENVGLN